MRRIGLSPSTACPRGIVRHLIVSLSPYRGRIALTLALTVAAGLLNLPVPLLIQGLIDRAIEDGGPSPQLVTGLLAVFVAQAATGLANAHAAGPVGMGVVRDLRHRLYARVQRLRLSYFDRTAAGSILSRLMDDVGAVQSLVSGQNLAVLADLGPALAVSGVLLWRCPRLAPVALAFVASQALSYRFFSRRIRAESAEARRRLDAVFGRLKATLDGVLVVKAHAREEAEMAEFSSRLAAAHAPRIRLGLLEAASSNLGMALNGVGAAVVFAVGAFEVLRGRMTPGGVVSTVALSEMLFGPVSRLLDLSSTFGRAAVSVDRLGEILDREPEASEPERPARMGRARGLIEFDGVDFGYEPGRRAVTDVRLRIEPGMKLALVGPTGCGKSTLVDLLLRFYDPTRGEIRLDGTPIRELAAADLRRQVGVVLQEPIIFRRTVAENIRYGAPGADDSRVEQAARAASAHGFISRLPDGYATLLGEGGHPLSLGERQRLSIARLLCADPAIVVLDEATSALDSSTEALIQSALAGLLRGRTSLVVAHRLATARDADLIAVLDGGRVVQVGTHDQLIADPGGLYRRLCVGQSGEAGPSAPSDSVAPPMTARGLVTLDRPPYLASA